MRELTFGEKAVGLSFNPGGNAEVNCAKVMYAAIIDSLHNAQAVATDGDVKRMYAIAITELQTSQMWAVKAITWS